MRRAQMLRHDKSPQEAHYPFLALHADEAGHYPVCAILGNAPVTGVENCSRRHNEDRIAGIAGRLCGSDRKTSFPFSGT
jgi:hypothetical protein